MLKWRVLFNPYLIGAIAALACAFGLWRWGYGAAQTKCRATEIERQLKEAKFDLIIMRADAARAREAVSALIAERDRIAADLAAARKEIAHVPPAPHCALPERLVRMLDRARLGTAGVQSAGGADGATPGAAASERTVAWTDAFDQWAQDAAQCRAQRGQLIGLQTYIREGRQ